MATLEERFWAKVDVDGPVPSHCPELGPCWIWTASKDNNGYGQIQVNINGLWRPVKAPRAVWLIVFGKFPQNGACHRCDNPACVRPSHIFDGTHADNARDASKKGRLRRPGVRYAEAFHRGKTHCAQGHPYDEENTYVYGPNRHRLCRTCRRIYKGAWRRKNHGRS